MVAFEGVAQPLGEQLQSYECENMQSLFNHQIFPVASQLPPIYTVVPMSLKDSQTSDVTCVHIMRNLIFLRLNVEFGKIYANLPNNHAP